MNTQSISTQQSIIRIVTWDLVSLLQKLGEADPAILANVFDGVIDTLREQVQPKRQFTIAELESLGYLPSTH